MALGSDDTIEILQLYARYSSTIDSGDDQGFARCFVPAGHFDNGMNVLEGREAIAAFAAQTHAALPGMRHDATNVVVDGDGARATGSAFLVGYRVDGGYQVIITGRYADELEKTSEGWCFSKRVFKADG